MVSARLKHRNLNDYFGLRGINVVDELFGEGKLCRCIPYDDRVSTVHLLDSFQVKQLAEPRDNLGKFLRKYGVIQIEGAQNLILEIATLLRLVGNEDNDAAGQWLPKRLRFHAYDFKRLLEGDVREFDRNATCGEIRVEDHRQSSQLRDCLNDGLGIVRHFQIDGCLGKRPQLGRFLR